MQGGQGEGADGQLRSLPSPEAIASMDEEAAKRYLNLARDVVGRHETEKKRAIDKTKAYVLEVGQQKAAADLQKTIEIFSV